MKLQKFRAIGPSFILHPSSSSFRNLAGLRRCLWHGMELVERLRQAGETVIDVQAAPQFAVRNERSFSIRPQESADYVALLDELRTMASRRRRRSCICGA